jgi:hypothetical protein
MSAGTGSDGAVGSFGESAVATFVSGFGAVAGVSVGGFSVEVVEVEDVEGFVPSVAAVFCEGAESVEGDDFGCGSQPTAIASVRGRRVKILVFIS